MTGRDRLRELLDAVLDEEHRTLDDMAEGAYASPFHFSRQLRRDAGEPPVAMRRRVVLERAAWQLRSGTSVTDAAFAAGYESVEGFARAYARAFGHPPSTPVAEGRGHWLPAPNGIHFHPPLSLWVDSAEAGARAGSTGAAGEVTALMVRHDLDDVRLLLEAAKGLTDDELDAVRVPGSEPLGFDGPDETLRQVLTHLVTTKEIWLAAVAGHEMPGTDPAPVVDLLARHEHAGSRWLAFVRDVARRGAWGDRLVDALCEPPESFVVGSVVAHVLTYAAHRRELARTMLRAAGHDPGPTLGDPIAWLRHQQGLDHDQDQDQDPDQDQGAP